jgi:hypothetical protein
LKASYTKIRELPPAWFEFLADQRPLSDVFYRLENGRFRHGLLEQELLERYVSDHGERPPQNLKG